MVNVRPDEDGPPLFADGLAQHGDRVALVTAEQTLTYAELDERVQQVAGSLGPRRLVLLEAANHAQAVVAYMAALRARHPVIVVRAGDEVAVRALTEVYDPDIVMTAASGWSVDERRPRARLDLHPDLALVLPTSGSTGSTKLVRLSRENLRANTDAIVRYLGLSASDRAVTTLPMQYCYGLSVINTHLAVGASLVLSELSVVDRCFWDLVEATRPTSFAGVPHTFELLERVGFERIDVPSLRYLTQAGGRMDPERVRRFALLGAERGWELFVMYGQTEATARMAYLPPPLAASHPHTIGVPVAGGVFRIDEAEGPGGGVGELVYRGPNVMLGYATEPADLERGRTVTELRTGDLARVTPEGLYEIVGRKSRFVKLFGLRVDLDRVERVLADDGVAALCTGDDAGISVAVECDDPEVIATRVSSLVGVPRGCIHAFRCDGLPRLANGKPDYATVARLASQTVVAHEPSPPSAGSRAGAVRQAFADVLGVEPADDDTFAGLGGDSLTYVELSVRLEQVLGHLPPAWHVTPVRDLVGAGAAPRRLAHADVTVVIRAVAITLVVGTHAGLWYLPGGAHALLAVAGFNFARFQRGALSVLRGAARIAAPSMAWLAVVAAASDEFGWAHVLLASTHLTEPGAHFGYWYVEVLVQILVGLAAVFAIPALARLYRHRPFVVALAVTAGALLVRFDVVELSTTYRLSRPDELLWLFSLGWCAALATTAARRWSVTAIAAASVPGFFDDAGRELVVAAVLLAVLWAPTVSLPRPIVRPLSVVASASLAIYLVHWQVYPPVLAWGGSPAAVAASLAAGTGAWWVATSAAARVAIRARTWPRHPARPRGPAPLAAPAALR